jgi:hypothetical protein
MFEKKQKDGEAAVSKEPAERFDVCYKSKLLNKYFDSKDELVKAEDEYKEAHKKELIAKEERLADVKKIQDLANDYFSTLKDNEEKKKALDSIATDKYNAYKTGLADFAKKHNGYHLTYTNNGGNVEFKVEEARRDEISDIFEANRRMMRRFFDDFWF